ncbi:MAG: glycosyltransferase family 2 protein [bacterium]
MEGHNNSQSNPKFSIVVPVFNEKSNLIILHERLTKVMENFGKSYEIIFIDDGSKDVSWNIVEQLHSKDNNVKGLKFSRNFGHHVALTAGMDISKGDAVILMDADLQDQPEEIPVLYKKFQEGYDVVFGIRKERQHNLLKRITSKIFLFFMNRIVDSDVPINSHIFRIMSRRIVDTIKQFRERERFITGLISFVGFKQTGVKIKHGKRFSGKTKYGLGKLIMLALNTLTSFSYKPLQLASIIGAIVSLFSFCCIIYLVIKKLIFDIPIMGWTSIMVTVLFIGGVQMLFLGILGEYIGRTYSEVQNRPIYIVEDKLV